MALDQYIHELLFHHDCVIVPQFGGFIGNYESAKLDKINKKIYPPSKRISFNTHLTNNDGLLANHLASKNNISYKEALNFITTNVHQIKNSLHKEKKYNFKNIGTIYIDSSNKIQFEPDKNINYLTDSYGLTSLTFIPVDNKAKEIPALHSTKNKPKKWVAAAIFLPIGAALMWFTLQNNTIKHHLANANILPFESTTIHYNLKKRNLQTNTIHLKENNLAENKNGIAQLSFFDNLSPIKVALFNKKKYYEAGRISTYVEPARVGNMHHVIGGCFSIKQNALNFLDELKAAGFDAYILPEKHKNLYAVAYGGARTKEETHELLETVKSKYNHKAWILSK